MTMSSGFDREVRFNIVEHIGVISTHSTGWNKELNLVSWNGGQPKYDIRDWDMDHEHMSRGVTLHEKEMRQIFELMKNRRMENRFKKEESSVPLQTASREAECVVEREEYVVERNDDEDPFEENEEI